MPLLVPKNQAGHGSMRSSVETERLFAYPPWSFRTRN